MRASSDDCSLLLIMCCIRTKWKRPSDRGKKYDAGRANAALCIGYNCDAELTTGHILWPTTHVTHQSIDPWPAWPVTC